MELSNALLINDQIAPPAYLKKVVLFCGYKLTTSIFLLCLCVKAIYSNSCNYLFFVWFYIYAIICVFSILLIFLEVGMLAIIKRRLYQHLEISFVIASPLSMLNHMSLFCAIVDMSLLMYGFVVVESVYFLAGCSYDMAIFAIIFIFNCVDGCCLKNMLLYSIEINYLENN